MSPFIVFLKKLHNHAGSRLYLNVAGMILIGFFEGIGIYMIIPLLGVIGVSSTANIGNIPISDYLDRLNLTGQPALLLILLVYVLLLTGVGLLNRKNVIWNTRIQQGFIRYLRMEVYRNMLQSEWHFFVRKRKSDFQHILTNELARVSQGTMLFMQLIASVLFTLIQILLAIWLSPLLTLVVLVSGFGAGFVARKFVRRAKKLGDRTTQLSQNYYFGLNDQLSGMKEIKSNMLEAEYIEWFDGLNKQMEKNNVDFVTLRSNTQFLYRTMAALLVAVFVYGSVIWFQVPPEYLLVLVLIFSRIWPRFSSMQANLEQMVSMLPAFDQLIRLTQEAREASEHHTMFNGEKEDRLILEDRIECRNISYRYDIGSDRFVLKDIDLIIPVHEMTAITGKSGSGKSTLIDILMGLVQPETGAVFVDGTKIDKTNAHKLRRSISYVSQDPFLFHTSIRSNLILGSPEASEEELWEALKLAAADEFVKKLPDGLDTIVGDRGIRLSGGEKQRIVLARALLRRPQILVLDEATSALDADHEEKIQEAIVNLRQRMTLIVIAHRLSTIRNADQVIVLDNGRIVQQGKFAQLIEEKDGEFHHMWRKQVQTASGIG